MYTIDSDGVVQNANKHYQALTGMWEREFCGKKVGPLLSKFFYNDRAVAIEAMNTGKKTSGLCRPIRTDRDLLVTAFPVVNEHDETELVLTVLRDVTIEIELQNKFARNLKITEQYEHELNYYRAREDEAGIILGASQCMNNLKTLITQIAPVDTTILLTGETGTGKEVISREIHNRSPRSDKPYIAVNCAAIPESLMESELFGYERGAFTGALDQRKPGYFEMANGGTLLLDEISEIPLQLQSKLLRVIQEKEIRRLGGTKAISLDVRIIAATNRDLKQESDEGRFRKDLYFRLCVIPIRIPALRERKDDIVLLVRRFLSNFNQKHNASKYFSDEALEVFTRYDWPGNVRELENIVERIVVVSRGPEIGEGEVSAVIGMDFLTESRDSESGNLKAALQNLERRMIENALEHSGSSYKAAKILGIAQSSVIRKAQKFGISGWAD